MIKLSPDGRVQMTWRLLAGMAAVFLSVVTCWYDLKQAVKGVVHVDDVERLEIQIQLQNRSLDLHMPTREQFMRRESAALIKRKDNPIMREQSAITSPYRDRNPIEKSHASISTRVAEVQPLSSPILPYANP